jgi:hypothetical protein
LAQSARQRQGRGAGQPLADTDAMQLHLEEISRNVAVGAHAVLTFDRAGWHTTPKRIMPKNVTPIWLPSRAPELNPVETSGSTCARLGSPNASSKLTTTSSTPHARPGTSSPPDPTS